LQRLNYNQIAQLYDEPIRDHAVDPNLLAYLAEHPALSPAEARVLDVGCGTGKQLSANSGHFPEMRLAGLDLFGGMLNIAQKRRTLLSSPALRGPGVNWVQGDSAHLPFASQTFDYACSQFAYAHFLKKAEMIQEVYRGLKPGGRFVMTNIDPWSMEKWAIYHYFPAARTLDEQDFLPVERFTTLMKAAGFSQLQVQRNHWRPEEKLADFLAYASQRHRTSQFMALSDEAYQAGLQRIEEDLAEGRQNVESEVCLVTISGDKL
jgi:ubiquinone/menaquinone biosynthesis C-methylase UbiE